MSQKEYAELVQTCYHHTLKVVASPIGHLSALSAALLAAH